jgi:hypothetical protein
MRRHAILLALAGPLAGCAGHPTATTREPWPAGAPTLPPCRPCRTAACPGDKPFTAHFYNEFDPKAATLTWGSDTAIVFAEQSGSGARYGRDGVEFWEHPGEVTVDFFGNKFACTTPEGRLVQVRALHLHL